MYTDDLKSIGINQNIPEPYEGEDTFIFVSYSHTDKETVYPIIRAMREEGYRVWYDQGIRPSAEFNKVIHDHLLKCGFVLVFFSEHFIASSFCVDEALFAKEMKKNLLIVQLEKTSPSFFDMRFVQNISIKYYEYIHNLPGFFAELYRTEGMDSFDDTITLKGDAALSFFRRLKQDNVTSHECKKIIGLDLRNNWIRYLPSNISRLTNLEALNLSSNTLRELPEEFSELKNLKNLDLSSNSFFDFPLILTQLPNLRSLNMGGNFLKTLPAELEKLTQLETLDIYRNWFTEFPRSAGTLHNLVWLDASYNQFRSLPTEFFQLTKLQKLDLNSTYLREIPSAIEQLDNLVTLDLSYNRLETPLPLKVVSKWITHDIFFIENGAAYDVIMASSGINLLKTEIVNFPKQVLLSNNLKKIEQQYALLDLS